MAGVSGRRIGERATFARSALVRFGSSAAGTTAIEYALVAVIFAVACIGVWNQTGSSIARMYDTIGKAVLGVM